MSGDLAGTNLFEGNSFDIEFQIGPAEQGLAHGKSGVLFVAFGTVMRQSVDDIGSLAESVCGFHRLIRGVCSRFVACRRLPGVGSLAFCRERFRADQYRI